jgi:hypothetical protein
VILAKPIPKENNFMQADADASTRATLGIHLSLHLLCLTFTKLLQDISLLRLKKKMNKPLS